MKKLKGISAFFPMYNDEGSVKLMYGRLKKVLRKVASDYEIIMVDDCSPDNSGKIADKIAKKDKKVRVIHHAKNRGYGGALKSGFYNAKKEWVFYTDGDAQYDVAELEKLVPFANDYDVVTGYKINRADGWYRNFVSTAYNIFVRIFFNLKTMDVDCDFRLMKRKIFDKLNLVTDGSSFDLEMMKRIQDEKFTIKNIPVHHYDRIHGTSAAFKPARIIKTIKELIIQWFQLVVFKCE